MERVINIKKYVYNTDYAPVSLFRFIGFFIFARDSPLFVRFFRKSELCSYIQSLIRLSNRMCPEKKVWNAIKSVACYRIQAIFQQMLLGKDNFYLCFRKRNPCLTILQSDQKRLFAAAMIHLFYQLTFPGDVAPAGLSSFFLIFCRKASAYVRPMGIVVGHPFRRSCAWVYSATCDKATTYDL